MCKDDGGYNVEEDDLWEELELQRIIEETWAFDDPRILGMDLPRKDPDGDPADDPYYEDDEEDLEEWGWHIIEEDDPMEDTDDIVQNKAIAEWLNE